MSIRVRYTPPAATIAGAAALAGHAKAAERERDRRLRWDMAALNRALQARIAREQIIARALEAEAGREFRFEEAEQGRYFEAEMAKFEHARRLERDEQKERLIQRRMTWEERQERKRIMADIKWAQTAPELNPREREMMVRALRAKMAGIDRAVLEDPRAMEFPQGQGVGDWWTIPDPNDARRRVFMIRDERGIAKPVRIYGEEAGESEVERQKREWQQQIDIIRLASQIRKEAGTRTQLTGTTTTEIPTMSQEEAMKEARRLMGLGEAAVPPPSEAVKSILTEPLPGSEVERVMGPRAAPAAPQAPTDLKTLTPQTAEAILTVHGLTPEQAAIIVRNAQAGMPKSIAFLRRLGYVLAGLGAGEEPQIAPGVGGEAGTMMTLGETHAAR